MSHALTADIIIRNTQRVMAATGHNPEDSLVLLGAAETHLGKNAADEDIVDLAIQIGQRTNGNMQN